ncbi:MAG TPA: DinB family protein [Terriglobales bacterium]|jgi:hypothetical protein|nr:DinB family protein [Terriglobales bacterium]
MSDKLESALRKQLVETLKGNSAHTSFDDAIAGLPVKLRGEKPKGFPHSPWMLVEHLRIALWDILEFSRNKDHKSPKWPEGYWPKTVAPPDAKAWDKTIKKFRKDLKDLEALAMKGDLTAKIPWGDGQTLLRQVLLAADHNAYHVAQIIDVRRLLGAWKG